ncbi:hypothetical protein AB0953_13010 [Streptomyces sp. NPDC046866]|uniref:hypothetical protein n=1 Tax=Streptomyces sp. NPDC046866 TaxID=3154921 RepID=UPI003456F0AF
MQERTETLRRRVARAVFRLAMAALIALLAVRTYEETAVALARANGSLRTAEATVTELTPHTQSGRSGGGQDGGSGSRFVHTEYTVGLRVGDGLKTVDGVPGGAAHGLREGQRVVAGMWRGRIVEVDGRQVWPGWDPASWDLALFVLYPLLMGYLIALAVAAAARLASVGGRARWERQDRSGPCLLGFLVAVAAVLVLLVCAAFGNGPAFWPLLPVGAGTAAALARLWVVVRQVRSRHRASLAGVGPDAPEDA